MKKTMQTKKTAMITGAARGIGGEIAKTLAEMDFHIIIVDVLPAEDARPVLTACETAGTETLFIQADISLTEGRRQIIESVRNRFSRLDLLVNNAGVAPKQRMDILDATEESYDRVMNINLKGPYFLTQQVANWMIEQVKTDPDYKPIIINISSLSAYTSSTARGEYCLSKAGVSMMTALYADRLSEFGINVYEIRPGIIKTDMTNTVQAKYDKLIAEGITPIKRWGYPDDIARAVCAIASGYFAFSTGEVFNVDGGYHLRRL